jgi:hypothetical protein
MPMVNFKWTIPGYAISNYVQATDYGIVYTNFPTTQSNIVFYWIDSGYKLVQVSAMVDGKTVTGQAWFKVTRPGATLDGTIIGEVRADGNYENAGTWLHFGGYPDVTNVVGIRWNAEVTTPTNGAGGIAFAQLINRDARRIEQSGANQKLTTSGAFVADNDSDDGDIFYDGTVTGIGNSDTGTHNDDDSPGLEYTAADKSISNNDQFQIYLMYKPDITNSIWVTLRTLTWQWSGSATNDPNSGWSLNPGATSSATPSVDSIILPTWTTNYNDSVGNNWIPQ